MFFKKNTGNESIRFVNKGGREELRGVWWVVIFFVGKTWKLKIVEYKKKVLVVYKAPAK